MSGLIAAIATGTVAVAGSISSFSQASKAKKRGQKAERDAKKAMAEAKKRLGVNVYEQLSIQKEPYELAREAALVAGAQGLQAGVEGSERGAAATAGRVFMGQQDAQAKIRAAMGQELQGIQQQVVGEEQRLKDLGMGINLGEVAGAQEAARDAQEQRAAALQAGFEGLIQAGSSVAGAAPLYSGGGAKTNVNTQSLGMNTGQTTTPGVRTAGVQPTQQVQAQQPTFGFNNTITADSQFIPQNINQLAGLGYIPFP
jgi:hypothetical protein